MPALRSGWHVPRMSLHQLAFRQFKSGPTPYIFGGGALVGGVEPRCFQDWNLIPTLLREIREAKL